jgi:hypothetical protein
VIELAIVQGFEIIKSRFPNESGDFYYTISDGVRSKGEFSTREEAEENIERLILNWRCDS